MKVAIIGSRSIENADIRPLIPAGTTEIISGGAKGIDCLAEQYAKKNGIQLRIIPPNYQKYGKEAPLIRNREIVELCEMVVAIWDGVSKGTIYTVRYAKMRGKAVKLFRFRSDKK